MRFCANGEVTAHRCVAPYNEREAQWGFALRVLLGLSLRSPFARALHFLDGFLFLFPGVHDQAVGDVVFIDVADIGHRLGPDLLGGKTLHIIEPDVRIQSTLGCQDTQLGNAARTGIVGSERKQGLVQLGHGLVTVILVYHPAHVLDAGVNVRLGLGDVAHT